MIGKRVKRVHNEIGNDIIKANDGLQSIRIKATTMSAHSPQSNDLSGKINRTSLEKVTAMSNTSNMKRAYCSEWVLHTTYLQNCTASKVLGNIMLYEALLRELLNNADIGILCSTAIIHTNKQ